MKQNTNDAGRSWLLLLLLLLVEGKHTWSVPKKGEEFTGIGMLS